MSSQDEHVESDEREWTMNFAFQMKIVSIDEEEEEEEEQIDDNQVESEVEQAEDDEEEEDANHQQENGTPANEEEEEEDDDDDDEMKTRGKIEWIICEWRVFDLRSRNCRSNESSRWRFSWSW